MHGSHFLSWKCYKWSVEFKANVPSWRTRKLGSEQEESEMGVLKKEKSSSNGALLALFMVYAACGFVHVYGASISCTSRSSPCFLRSMSCPAECPTNSPSNPNSKVCYVNCNSPICKPECKSVYSPLYMTLISSHAHLLSMYSLFSVSSVLCKHWSSPMNTRC